MNDPLSHIWAKSPEKAGEKGESLSTHTTLVLERLAERRERVPDLCHFSGSDCFCDLAAWTCALHDVGKIARGFQKAVRGNASFEHRHEVLSLAFVGSLSIRGDDGGSVAAAVATHHRSAREILEAYPFGGTARNDLLGHLVAEDEQRIPDWLSNVVNPTLRRLGFAELPSWNPTSSEEALGLAFRNMQGTRRTIEDDPAGAMSKTAMATRLLRGFLILSDHAASAHQKMGWAETLESPSWLEREFEYHGRTFWPHQHECKEVDGNAILTAPTGSGKTEAALLWAARQRESGPGSSTIFYMLPYKASMNAMRQRIPGKFGVAEDSVVLQHSTATASLFSILAGKGYTDEEARRLAKQETNIGRLMTAPVRILTPYQLLRSVFGLRGHDAILTDATRGLFIFDELHAYETGRLALILATVGHLARQLGGRFFAMSATFPRFLQELFRGVVGGEIRHVDADGKTRNEFARHQLRIADDDLLSDATLADISARHDRGETVLVVCTTVARAQEVYTRLTSRVPVGQLLLLHSRFTVQDRNRLESEIGSRLATGKRNSAAGLVVVATQVVEVSLDVDFDALHTDPAPLEALLQRFGRVNRGRRGGLREVVVHSAIPDTSHFIYSDEIINKALSIIIPFANQPVREENLQSWVDECYSPIAGRLKDQIRGLVREYEETVIRTNLPLDTHDELARQFEELFDGCEVVPKCHEAAFREFLKTNPLKASELVVPISTARLVSLKRKGLVTRISGSRTRVVDAPYDEVRGLMV
ncbi:MAG: CRISPR-associated helicase Cas3' [Deltaproteobacteria bacterium]|nr:CRISPR-associated helicase Cas3' [Deltaproteobacteria bacterium]